MCGVTMPSFEAIKKPLEPRDFTAEEKAFISSSKAEYTADKVPKELVGNGDVPDTGPVAVTEAGTPPEGPGWAALERVLNSALAEAAQGAWREGGNPKIIATFKLCGYKSTDDVATPWCAGFASQMLSDAGIEAPRSLSSFAFNRVGSEIGTGDWSRLRKNDIIIWQWVPGKGHVAFFRGYDKSSNRILALGGNQSNNVTLVPFPVGQIISVRRAWTVPPEYDKPLYTNAAGKPLDLASTR